MGRLGEDTGKWAPMVSKALKDAGRDDRLSFYKALPGDEDVPMTGCIPLLVEAFERIAEDRVEIAAALGRFGPRAERSIECLTAARKDDNADVRRAADEALKRIRKAEN